MRQQIRAAQKRGCERIAVVCGAWHAPVLAGPLPPATADAKLLRGMPRRKVTTTWVPWTHARLAYASGYGAGITSPGWYHHLWTAPDRPITRWLTRVAGTLRNRDLVVSSAHVIEAVRLAETLAVLRGRPLAGLAEVTEATRAVLCDGDELAVRLVTDELVVGQALGSVDPDVPTVPLEADLQRPLPAPPDPPGHHADAARPGPAQGVRPGALRAVPSAPGARPGLDPAGGERGGQPRHVPRDAGSRSGGRSCRWRSSRRRRTAPRSRPPPPPGCTETIADGTLVELTEACERCLRAELPDALALLLDRLTARAALDVDVVHLMDALPPLARAQRYGDVRGTDTSALSAVSRTLLVRICAALPAAVTGLDDDNARLMRRRLDAVNGSIGLIEPEPPAASRALAAAGDGSRC